MHDLEIRGAGEVLGENQSGNMLEVGFQLYNEMLAEAVRCPEGRQGSPDLLHPCRRRPTSTCTPRPCCPTTTAATCTCACRSTKAGHGRTSDQIDGLLEEIVDRFGKLPAQAQTLIDVHRLRVLSQPYGVVKRWMRRPA